MHLPKGARFTACFIPLWQFKERVFIIASWFVRSVSQLCLKDALGCGQRGPIKCGEPTFFLHTVSRRAKSCVSTGNNSLALRNASDGRPT